MYVYLLITYIDKLFANSTIIPAYTNIDQYGLAPNGRVHENYVYDAESTDGTCTVDMPQLAGCTKMCDSVH